MCVCYPVMRKDTLPLVDLKDIISKISRADKVLCDLTYMWNLSLPTDTATRMVAPRDWRLEGMG